MGALCLAALAGPAAAASDVDDVKLAFLYNFTKFVEWPRAAFETDRSPIVIAIAGDDALAASFAAEVANKPVGERPVVVRSVPESGPLPACHVLFVRAASRRRVAEVADALADSPVLLVGEQDRFLTQGGMVSFVLRAERVRFDINLAAARRSGLKLSSRLVNVANVVLGPEREVR